MDFERVLCRKHHKLTQILFFCLNYQVIFYLKWWNKTVWPSVLHPLSTAFRRNILTPTRRGQGSFSLDRRLCFFSPAALRDRCKHCSSLDTLTEIRPLLFIYLSLHPSLCPSSHHPPSLQQQPSFSMPAPFFFTPNPCILSEMRTKVTAEAAEMTESACLQGHLSASSYPPSSPITSPLPGPSMQLLPHRTLSWTLSQPSSSRKIINDSFTRSHATLKDKTAVSARLWILFPSVWPVTLLCWDYRDNVLYGLQK